MSSPLSKRKCGGSPVPGTSKAKVPLVPSTHHYSSRLLTLFRERELGIGNHTYFPEKAYQMKIQDFEKMSSHTFGNRNETSHTVYFVRAGMTALLAGMYVQVKSTFFNVVAQLHYDHSRFAFGKTPYVTSYQNRIVDACQLRSDPDCFLSVSFTKKCSGEVQVACGMRRYNNTYNTFKYKHPSDKAFWCCSGNQFTERFALGCDREICLYSVNGLNDIISFPGNIYSLAFNRCGTALHMGTEKGLFHTFDLRACEIVSRITVGSSLIDDVLLLSSEHDCIVSEVTGKLQKIQVSGVTRAFQSYAKMFLGLLHNHFKLI